MSGGMAQVRHMLFCDRHRAAIIASRTCCRCRCEAQIPTREYFIEWTRL